MTLARLFLAPFQRGAQTDNFTLLEWPSFMRTIGKDIHLINETSTNVEKNLVQFNEALNPQKTIDLAVRRCLLLQASSVSYEDAQGE